MIHVTLTTEEGEVLDTFSLKETPPDEEVNAIGLSHRVRDYLDHRFEVEDL